MRQSLTKNEYDMFWIASVTDEYDITTVYETIYPADIPFFNGQVEILFEYIFSGLRHTMEEFQESCERRGYAGLLGAYDKRVIMEATQRDDWERIVGIRERPKTLEEVHRGCEL